MSCRWMLLFEDFIVGTIFEWLVRCGRGAVVLDVLSC
jgi:hypothetical protein